MLNSTHLKQTKKKTSGDKALDRVVMVVSILYPLSALPQLIEIIHGNSAGVSVVSWLSFLTCAGLFLVYGLRHRVMPMIVSNSLWVVIDGMVVASLIVVGRA
jgi:uncharacterized protein with PQ loop repeat